MKKKVVKDLIEILTTDSKETSLTREDILLYFNIEDQQESYDLLSNTRTQNDIDIEKCDLILLEIKRIILDEIKSKKNNASYNLLRKIQKHREDNHLPSTTILGKSGVSSSEFSRFKKAAYNLKKTSPTVFKNLSEYLNQFNINEKIIDTGDIIHFIENNITTNKLTSTQKKNLCGSYVSFRRSNYKVNGNQRLLKVFILDIYLNPVEQKLKYQYAIKNSNGIPVLTSGYIFRNTIHSIVLVGIKYSAELKENIDIISLSINDEGLNILFSPNNDLLNQNQTKKYINGSCICYEESSEKPYSTWIHLSKLKGDVHSLNNIQIEKYNFTERTLAGISGIFPFDEFKKSNQELHNIIENIKDNYGKRNTVEYIISDLNKKLFLQNDFSHFF